MANIADRVFELIRPTVEDCGVRLWDVRYVKEGASMYLRVFIDKDGGVDIDDCTDVSHAIDPVIDLADPISESYYLEVCSPGIERELSRPEHFARMIGKKIKIKLYRALDSKKEFTGILTSAADTVTLDADGREYRFGIKDISKANLCDFE